MNVKSFIDPRRWHSPSYPGSTYPRLELTPPPCHHATRPTSERGRSLFRQANLYVHPLCTCVRVCVCVYARATASPFLSLSPSSSLAFSPPSAPSRCVRAYVYAGISQRAPNLWSREARFNPLRLVSGYSFRLRPASAGILIRRPPPRPSLLE